MQNSNKLDNFKMLNSLTTSGGKTVTNINDKQFPTSYVFKGLAQHKDTCLIANEMNNYNITDKLFIHDFLYHGIPKYKRYGGSWSKNCGIIKDEVIVNYFINLYKYSMTKAIEATKVLTTEEKNTILLDYKKCGGKKK